MPLQEIKLNFDSMNVSVQVGDIAYYSYNTNNIAGFDHSTLETTKKLGEIIGVNQIDVSVGLDPGATTVSPYNTNIIVEYDPTLMPAGWGGPIFVLSNSFISFAKEKKINTSSLLGYYADVRFVNDSPKKAELFSISSIIEESSK